MQFASRLARPAVMALSWTFCAVVFLWSHSLSAADEGGETLAERACDMTHTTADRLAALTSLIDSHLQDREKWLLVVVTGADDEIAATATNALLLSENKELSRVMSSRYPKLTRQYQAVVLSSVRHFLADVSWRSIVRTWVDTIVQDVRSLRPEDSLCVNFAGLILSESRDPGDFTRLCALVQRYPNVSGPWLGLASGGELPNAIQGLATHVYEGVDRAPMTRLAAAIAVAPMDPQAAAFVREQIESVLSSIGGLSIDRILAESSNVGGTDQSGPRRVDMQTLQRTVSLAGLVRYLHTNAAHEYMMLFLHAKNEYVRAVGELLLALRWPDELVGADLPPEVTPEEHDNMVGAIVFLHPELRGDVEGRYGTDAVSALLDRVRKAGLGGTFGYAARAVIGG